MIRNLKVLFAAALALTAFGAIAANAQAAHEFHCSVTPCVLTTKTDGAAKSATAHHVFIVENAAKTESVSFTCESFRADAEFIGKTTNEITTRWADERKVYDECKVNGTPGVEVHMNTCDYLFRGGVGGTTDAAEVHVNCTKVGDVIEVTLPSGCVMTVSPGTYTGIGYHNVGKEVTITGNIPNIPVTADGTTATCGINPAQTLVGTYTTGNTLVTAETTSGVEAEGKFE